MNKKLTTMAFLLLSTACTNHHGNTAVFIDSHGKNIGTSTYYAHNNGVRFILNLDLPAGERAFHIHEKGFCSPPDFKTSGAHFNPHNKQHGRHNPHGHHSGDMPNLVFGNNGQLHAVVDNTHVTLSNATNGLLDADGSSLIIHANADDHMTDPAGNAGGRIACAVIAPPIQKESQP